jgi:hypothetical protein
MEYPDHLKTPVPIGGAGSADLGDWLADELRWDAANWDPGTEPPVPATPGAEPAGTAVRLRHGGPEPIYRALARLARLGALPGLRWPRAWPAAASPGPAGPGPAGPGASCPGDPWPPGGPAAGPATARAVGVQEALKTPGVRLICITGPAGVGKTRLAIDIVTESQSKLAAGAGSGVRAVPLLTAALRSVESPAGLRRLARTAPDAWLDLLLALGVPEHDLPATPAERHARYLAELAELHPVILIDDVVAEEQVMPLLPAKRGVVVITSRDGVAWSSVTGAVNIPVVPLNVGDTGTLVRDVFRAYQAEADGATAKAVHEWCRGTPLPVILISRWLAATGQPLTSLGVARQDWNRAHGELAGTGVRDGFPAVAAVLGLLDADQQMIVRMFGMLRLPEADLAAMCAATGLSRDRATAALRELTRIGLLAGTDPGPAWAMAPGVTDYAAGWACAADPDPAETQQLLDRLLGCYQRRVHGLLDAHAALARANSAGAAEWAAAELVAARPVVATTLDAAARTGQPGRARELAADYLAATSVLDGRAAGARETERFIGPVLAVANAAGHDELAARALARLGPDADPQAEEPGDIPAEPGGPQAPAADSPAGDSLSPIQGDPGDAEVPGRPVLFGAGA